MQRRDVIKLLASSAVLSVMSLEVLQTLQQAQAQVGKGIGLRTLNAHQDATVMTITELIIPETETPGAKGARVNEFIDLLLTEWYDKADADRFLEGLAKVDVASRSRFGKDFIHCTLAQQTQLMKQWDDEAISMAHSQKPADTAYTPAPPPTSNFFYSIKRLTLVGYYTSEIGFSKELGKQIIPPKHDGCAPLVEARS